MRNFIRITAVLCIFAAPSIPTRAQQAPELDDLKQEGLVEIDSQRRFTQQMVDQVFSFSELGFQEFETFRYLTGVLEKNGFRVERGVAGIPTAWVATYGSGKPVVAFMTDIDCIPRASQKPGVAYHDPIVEGAPGHGEGHPMARAWSPCSISFTARRPTPPSLPGRAAARSMPSS